MSDAKIDRAKEIIVDGIAEAIEKVVAELQHHGVSKADALKAVGTGTGAFEALLRTRVDELG